MQDSNAAEKLWFSYALNSCFGTDASIPYAVFLKVFTAPMCVPWNRNYGKVPDQRKSGAGTQRRGAEDVFPLQLQLLKQYEARVPKWNSDFPAIKVRLQELSDDLVHHCLPREKGYADKHHNHKAQNYLSFFLQAQTQSEETCRELFRRTAGLYALALEKLFQGSALTPEARLEIMESAFLETCSGQNPRLPSDGSASARMGWYMAALLLLGAAQTRLCPESSALAECLLGVTLLEEGRTISVPTISKLTLQRSQFCCILTAALRAELELEEIREIHQLFRHLRQMSDNQLDVEMGLLLEQFLEAIDCFGQRRSRELADSWNDSQALEQIAETRVIYKDCRSWLK